MNVLRERERESVRQTVDTIYGLSGCPYMVRESSLPEACLKGEEKKRADEWSKKESRVRVCE